MDKNQGVILSDWVPWANVGCAAKLRARSLTFWPFTVVLKYQQMIRKEEDLEFLLNLDGQRFQLPDGRHWVKFEARRCEPTKERPHGIRYNLTLHAANGIRLIGFDNAHAVDLPKSKRYVARRFIYDHKHRSQDDKGVPYEFSAAAQLVSDFWSEVEKIVGKL